ncbi:MAG TPA: hypothetical protein PLE42_02220 [Candidatus Competibacteraceae bacterium]|nr:MAG: hypothetical protein EKK69_05645 [Candidatus Competibacteraceae bacterium]HNW78045.1 hypothetical protein [Candidatus Competibacteraceae bacterium]HQC71516.1 hypothetical protein [Candidatus Competibacteraceae bacterium]
MSDTDNNSAAHVRHFRQILLWPLQLMPFQTSQIQKHWELLQLAPDNPWAEVDDEFPSDPAEFKERHYAEFITFLPYVQRFLYGEGSGRGAGDDAGYGESPIKVFRRTDVARARVTFEAGETPVLFEIAHIDLYFFLDLDIAILVVEIHTHDLSLHRAQDALARFGRAYPPNWSAAGQGGHCLSKIEWLDHAGTVLAASDYENREKFLRFACEHRTPRMAAHWEYLLRPMVLHYSDRNGALRYRQIEYHRMPLMGYLALDDPRRLTRGDYVRLGLVAGPGASGSLPYSERYLQDFETRYCYDRYREDREGHDWIDTRTMCCGHAFVIVGNHKDHFFTDAENGLLSHFRHQYFLLFLIAHMHKVALLMLSDRLVVALSRLEIHDVESVKRFKREIRHTMEIFLRFTHRYWFHELSNQMQLRDLYQMCVRHLDTPRLYNEVRQSVYDMHGYLESDGIRRQANTVVRLTVVTTFGMIGTITTGILGMNVFDEAGEPSWYRLLLFMLVFVPTTVLTLYTIEQSKSLADFLEALANERWGIGRKFKVLFRSWWRRPNQPS